MKFGFILTLLGLGLEMFGALVLSVESIGLERVETWMRYLGGWREQTEIDKMSDPRVRHRVQGVLIGIYTSLGILAGGVFAKSVEMMFGESHRAVWAACGTLAAGLIAAFFVPVVIKYVLSAAILILRFAEQKTLLHTAGLVGFLFLLAGFTFQFLGTLIDALSHWS